MLGYQRAKSALSLSRPMTAASRPRSAMDTRIVPVKDADEADAWGGWAGQGKDGEGDEVEDTLDQHTVTEIFCHMDAVQRDKNENR